MTDRRNGTGLAVPMGEQVGPERLLVVTKDATQADIIALGGRGGL